MEISAKSNYLHISPKKIKEFGKISIGFNPKIAIDSLLMRKEKAGKLLAKCIKSCLDNAINTHRIDASRLRIQSIQILKGPHLKRWRAVSRGMAHQIKRRTTHIKVILSVVEDEKKKKNMSIKPMESIIEKGKGK